MQNARQTQILALTLDPGEASAIALALEHAECLLIIDERHGRSVAQQLGLSITGTLGVLLEAKKSGYLPAVKPLLEAIANTNFCLSTALVQLALRQAGE